MFKEMVLEGVSGFFHHHPTAAGLVNRKKIFWFHCPPSPQNTVASTGRSVLSERRTDECSLCYRTGM